MTTIIKKKDFIVCEGIKRLLAHHKKALSQYDGEQRNHYVNYVHFISDITIRKMVKNLMFLLSF